MSIVSLREAVRIAFLAIFSLIVGSTGIFLYEKKFSDATPTQRIVSADQSPEHSCSLAENEQTKEIFFLSCGGVF